MSDEVAIRVEGVSKDFKLPLDKHNSLKSKIVHAFGKTKGYQTQHALKDVSFEVKKGEFFGIVGRNGSGKSTLLKMLAGIYQPTSGKISVNGKLVPFIELGVGFNPELTGRENVFLNGALLGFNNEQVAKMYDDIVEFAELEKFMDQKLKNYSSGMQVRLAFSMAIRANADILVLDEVLAVGDEAFQRKCYQYFAELKRNKQTVILVTHSMEVVQRFCTRAMLIDKSHSVKISDPLEIAQMYLEINDQEGVTVNVASSKQTTSKYVDARIKYNKTGQKRRFRIEVSAKKQLIDPVVALGISNEAGEEIYRWASDEKLPFNLDFNKHRVFEIELDDIFPVGIFRASLFVKKKDRSKDYAIYNNITRFEVKNLSQHTRDVCWKIPERTLVNGKEVTGVQ